MNIRAGIYRVLSTIAKEHRRKLYGEDNSIPSHIVQSVLNLPLPYLKGPMITVTKKAAEAISKIAESEDLGGQWIRLRVIGGGCAGFNYDLYFEPTITDMDETFESNGVKLCCDPLSYQYLEGTEVHYVDNGLTGSGFKFVNPNVKSTCGCGSSFSA